MFHDPGHKLQGVAMALFVLEMLTSVFIGLKLISINPQDAIWGLLIIIFGIVIAWISSLVIYGFGELIVRNAQTARNTALLARHFNANPQQSYSEFDEFDDDENTDEI